MIRSSYLRRVVVGLALGATAALSLVAVGAAAAANAPSATQATYDVQLWPGADPGRSIVIVSVTLPDTAALPATVRIPVVAGTTIDWAGEILPGSDGTQDPSRSYTVAEGTGGQYAQFELSESRQAQIELSGTPLDSDGTSYSTRIDYVQTVPAQSTGFSVRVPAGAADVKIEPKPASAPETNPSGEALYTLPSTELAPGGKQQLSVSYRIGGASPRGGGISQGQTIGLLAALVVLAAGVLALLLNRQRSNQ